MLMNNPDRINTIWGNSGNPHNVYFWCDINEYNKGRDSVFTDAENTANVNVLQIVPIDNQTYPMTVTKAYQGAYAGIDAFQDYLRKIQGFVEKIFDDVRTIRCKLKTH